MFTKGGFLFVYKYADIFILQNCASLFICHVANPSASSELCHIYLRALSDIH